jgi:hypothetical protein
VRLTQLEDNDKDEIAVIGLTEQNRDRATKMPVEERQ